MPGRDVIHLKGRDAIHLRGLVFYAYHGVRPEEKAIGQRFILDVDLFGDLRKAGESDRLEDTADYGAVYRVIEACVCGESYQLLERLAEEIAGRILREFPCDEVRVEVHKPQAPVPGVFQDVSVEIWRGKGETLEIWRGKGETS